MKYEIKIEPEGRIITAEKNMIIKRVLGDEHIYFHHNCGGKGKCSNCRIRFMTPAPDPRKNEIKFFGEDSVYRLACTHRLTQDCTIFLPETENLTANKTIKNFRTQRKGEGYGFGIDLGTTTVAVYLVNLKSGKIIHQSSFLNPQVSFGSDVITRLELAKDKTQLYKMKTSITSALEEKIAGILEDKKINAVKIKFVSLAGNTVMTHLFLGENIKGLERLPFTGSLQKENELSFEGRQIGLSEECHANLFPILSGFIGGDTASAVIAADFDIPGETRILVDLGTNGEIVLSDSKGIRATSTAAGPAFDGMGMYSGMPALEGAIEGFSKNGEAMIIGGTSAKGICGSGYISAIAHLLNRKLLNYSGLLESGSDELRAWFPVDGNSEVQLIQEDVRKFQLAKGAVAAGIEILCKEAQTEYSEIDELIVTGSFGNKIDIKAALTVGLFPSISESKIRFMDNAAGRGAVICLDNSQCIKRLRKLRENINIVNLGGHPDFQDIFVMNMLFNTTE